VIEPQPDKSWTMKYEHRGRSEDIVRGSILSENFMQHCRFGKVGNFLYMREPLYCGTDGFTYYKDDYALVFDISTNKPFKWPWKKDVLSQLYMPKRAMRSLFQYVSIRVERVQEISDKDAKAEGVSNCWRWDAVRDAEHPEHFARGVLNPYVANYSVLWDEINAKRGYGWDVNPWVWVLEYKPLDLRPISVINSNMETPHSALSQGERENTMEVQDADQN
jgi:hypothetical protein